MKIKLNKLLLALATLFILVSNVNAASCNLADAQGFCLDMTKHYMINGKASLYFGADATKIPGNTYFKVSDDNEILYCSNVVLSTDHLTDALEPIDQNCREKTSIEKSIIYLYEYGYGNNLEAGQYDYNSKYLYGNDVFKDYYITQSAAWYFYPPNDDPGDEWLFNPENDGVDWNTFWFNEGFNFTEGTYYGKTYDIVTKISALVNDAKNASNAKPELSITVPSPTLKVTLDGKYYISEPITLRGKYLTEKITLSVTGLNGSFVTIDKNQTSGITTLSNGTDPLVEQTLYIKVPASNIKTSDVNIKLNISSQSTFNDESDIIECNPGKRKYDQSMIKFNPNIENLSSELTFTAQKYPIKISKSNKDGELLLGATLVIKKGNDVIETWTSTNEAKTILLAPGIYTLVETKAPEGYILNNGEITFTVTDNASEVEEINMINEPIIITVSKKETKKEKELSGAALRITDQDGNIVKDIDGNELEWITTDKPKSFHIAKGTYILEETKAPEGYELSDKKIEFTVHEDGKVTIKEGLIIKKDEVLKDNQIVFENTPEPKPVDTGSIMVYTATMLCLLSLGISIYFIVKRKEI